MQTGSSKKRGKNETYLPLAGFREPRELRRLVERLGRDMREGRGTPMRDWAASEGREVLGPAGIILRRESIPLPLF